MFFVYLKASSTLMMMFYFPLCSCNYSSSVGRIASFHLFIHLCIYFSMVSWIFIDLGVFILFTSLFIVLLKWSQLWPSETLKSWFLCHFEEPMSSFFSHFLFMHLLSGAIRYSSWLLSCIFCVLAQESVFFEELWILWLENGI